MTTPTGTTNTTQGSNQDSLHKVLYTKSIDQSGWLSIKLEGGNVTVPEFVKVSPTEEKGGRLYFLVLEGRYKGKFASLSKENVNKCLIDTQRGNGAKLVAKAIGYKWLISVPRGNEKLHQLMATLEFDGKKATITLDSDVDYKETNSSSPHYLKILHSKPLPKGKYKIFTPETAHNARNTNFYADSNIPGSYPGLKYHTVWFQIENPETYNSNYVHVGNLSEGCVTMYELEMWNPLYLYLISNRLDKGGKYVGIITIE